MDACSLGMEKLLGNRINVMNKVVRGVLDNEI
jgi:hypothetical protein